MVSKRGFLAENGGCSVKGLRDLVRPAVDLAAMERELHVKGDGRFAAVGA